MSNYYGRHDEHRSRAPGDEGDDSYYRRSPPADPPRAAYAEGYPDHRTEYFDHPGDPEWDRFDGPPDRTEHFEIPPRGRAAPPDHAAPFTPVDEYGRRDDPAPRGPWGSAGDRDPRVPGDADADFDRFGRYAGGAVAGDPYRPRGDPYGARGDPYGAPRGDPDGHADPYGHPRPSERRALYRDETHRDAPARAPRADPYADPSVPRGGDRYGYGHGDRYGDGYGHGGPPGPGSGEGYDDGDGRRPRRNRTRTALLVLLSLILMLGGGLVLGAYLWSESIGDKVARQDVFGDLKEEDRPEKADNESLNFLLAGTDAARDGEKTTGQGRQGASGRADTIMIVHLSADREHAYLISIPRDTYVNVPGHGKRKINASFALGGPSLYVRTVEEMTGLRIDHYAAIDWAGFESLTNALGGVEMTFDEETLLAGDDTVPAGTHTLDGETALAYVRERKSLEGGDLDRAKRQQNFMRSLMAQTLSRGTLTNPGKLNGALNAVVNNLQVDETFSNQVMRNLAVGLRGLRTNDVEFMTIPLADPATAMVDGKSIVRHDAEKTTSLFEAVRDDRTQEWLTNNQANTLGNEVN